MNLTSTFLTIKLGGWVMAPLLLIAFIAIFIVIDKIIFYYKDCKINLEIIEIIEKYNFNWRDLKTHLNQIQNKNIYKQFLNAIIDNSLQLTNLANATKNQHQNNSETPIWWLESRAVDEAKNIEKKLSSSLWLLETIITIAPLIGLFGTIIGMMDSFKIIGDNSEIINPNGITAGVAQSLIATAGGLIIAIFSLIAFNFFSRKQALIIEDFERLGTKIIDHIKLDSHQQ